MKDSVNYFGNVYYEQDGKERMRQVFGKQHCEITSQATKLASSLKVSRLMVVSMHYNKNLENYMNATEWFDYEDDKFKLKDKFKENVL